MTDGKVSGLIVILAVYTFSIIFLGLIGQNGVTASANDIRTAGQDRSGALETIWKLATFEVQTDYTYISLLFWAINVVLVLILTLVIRGG